MGVAGQTIQHTAAILETSLATILRPWTGVAVQQTTQYTATILETPPEVI